jgi:hypothetical protein
VKNIYEIINEHDRNNTETQQHSSSIPVFHNTPSLLSHPIYDPSKNGTLEAAISYQLIKKNSSLQGSFVGISNSRTKIRSSMRWIYSKTLKCVQ